MQTEQIDYSFKLVVATILLGVFVACVGSIHPIHVLAVNFHHHLHLWR